MGEFECQLGEREREIDGPLVREFWTIHMIQYLK